MMLCILLRKLRQAGLFVPFGKEADPPSDEGGVHIGRVDDMQSGELRRNAFEKLLRRMNFAEEKIPDVCNALPKALRWCPFEGRPSSLSLYKESI
jgi:hypothetical protein